MTDLETFLRERLPALADTDLDPSAALGPARLAVRARRRTAYAAVAAAACVAIGGGVVAATQLGSGPARRVAVGGGASTATWGPFLGQQVSGSTWYLSWLAAQPAETWNQGAGPDLTLAQTDPSTVEWTLVTDGRCTIVSGTMTFGPSGQPPDITERTQQGPALDCLQHDPARAAKVLAAVRGTKALGLTATGRLVVVGAGAQRLAEFSTVQAAPTSRQSRQVPPGTEPVRSSTPYAGDWAVDYYRLGGAAAGLNSGRADLAISGSGSSWKLTTGGCRDMVTGLTVTGGVVGPERSGVTIDFVTCPSQPSLSDAPVGEILDATRAIRTDASGHLYLIDVEGNLVATLVRFGGH